jgi:hypothetical protein
MEKGCLREDSATEFCFHLFWVAPKVCLDPFRFWNLIEIPLSSQTL